jgi:hypothetical protein
MPAMLSHLLLRVLHGMPVLVSSNWAAWILGIATFLLTELLLFKTTAKEERWGRLKVNLLIGIGVTAFAYSVLFAWSTVRTVYDDHHDSTGRWRAVVNEKNTLKGMLQVRDAYIKRLEAGAATKPSVIQTTKFVPQPKKCWVDSVGKYPNPQTGHTVALVTLHCNYRVDAPLRISLATNRPIANFNYLLPSGEVPIVPMGQVSGTEKGVGVDRSLYIDLQGPSFSAEQMVVIQVESMTTDAPIPLNGSINSK